jgi:carbon storage regulator
LQTPRSIGRAGQFLFLLEKEFWMLVLARRTDEKIVIGEGIVVTVLAIKGNAVRLGIEAPPEVPVHREEIARSIGLHDHLATLPRASEPALLASR